MLKKTIKYVDFDGNKREEDHYFHLTPPEMLDLENSVDGGLKATLDKALQMKNGGAVLDIFKSIVDKSYGIKTTDGRGFKKSPEILDDFKATNAYVELFMELVTNEAAAKSFADAVLPDMNKYIPANAAANA